ncbi:hypothetical protein BGAL_0006g00410 [Botrytis galanthina]|uniref:2EXR domain-containing protein n=1 Tax=Botrytis galanthina TaxID=278940 RepID=A0A4S8RL56_9HELO|nr:hypothetical protein BGAL_0006g00410 [Botrytis galanthina]
MCLGMTCCTDKAPSSTGFPKSFHLFAKLPTELRLQIWNYAILLTSPYIGLSWSQSENRFISDRKPPPILHTSSESRSISLAYWTFSSPIFSHTCINYDQDFLCFNWPSMGSIPGRLGGKITDEECRRIKKILIHEHYLIPHVFDNLREFKRFEGLEELAIACHHDDIVGMRRYGYMFAQMCFDKVDEVEHGWPTHWPKLVCSAKAMGQCSKHWWFDRWNDRAMSRSDRNWQDQMAMLVRVTARNDIDPEVFHYNSQFLRLVLGT